MKLIVGLGNYTKEYEKTRHNCGFLAADEFAEDNALEFTKEKFRSFFAQGIVSNEKVVVLKPKTFMNNSGLALREAVDFYSLEPSDLIVLYDDVDLPTGQLRIKKSGSAGTHNGMKSLVEHLGSSAFPRVRIGISSPPEPMDMADYVLSRFSDEEKAAVAASIKKASKAVSMIISGNIDMAMNIYNQKEKSVLEEKDDEA